MLKKIAASILLLSFVPSAYAATSANVEIHNNVSSNSNSQTNSYTNITVETNGKVTHYESDKPGDVEVKSTNGESSIKVNGQEVSPTISTSKQTVTPTPTKANEEESNKHESLFQKFIAKFIFLRRLFFWQH